MNPEVSRKTTEKVIFDLSIIMSRNLPDESGEKELLRQEEY